MTSYLFPPSNSEDLSTGNYYIHLVNSVPSPTYTTANQLNISDAIGYYPVSLTGLIYTPKKWTFSSVSFPTYTFNTVPIGVVICKKLSNNPAPSDPILYYADITNVLAQPIILTTGKYAIKIVFPQKGIIIFSDYYQYYAGNYVNNDTIPKGLMYMLGSRNDTQAYLSPFNNAVIDNSVPSTANLFDRQLSPLNVTQEKYCFNFGSRRIRVGTIAFWCEGTQYNIWTAYGSNTYVSGTIDVDGDWTVLCSSTYGYPGVNFMTSVNNTYWKHIKFVNSSRVGVLVEVEFYNSSMYSTDADLMSTVLDSSFEASISENSGFNHVWGISGTPTIINNSLYLNGSSRIALPSSPVLNLSNRNFKFNIETSSIINPYDNYYNSAIFTIGGYVYPFTIGRVSGQYRLIIDSYVNGSMGIPTNDPNIWDSAALIRTGNNLSAKFDNTTSVTANAIINTVNTTNSISVGYLSESGVYISGYIRNLKIVT